MGACGSRTGHDGEDFVMEVLRTLKLKNMTFEEVKLIISKKYKEFNTTEYTGFSVSKEEALEIISNFYDNDPKRNYYISYHKLLLKYIIETEYKNSKLEKMNIYNLIFLIFSLLKRP